MVIFPGSDCAAMMRALQSLNIDVPRIGQGLSPSELELEHAPLIDKWAFSVMPAPCLQGSVYGHPIVGQRSRMTTGWLVAVDPVAGWGRTWSRFYRLGYPDGAFPDCGRHS